ncbi:hypothetical protein HMPREF3232_01264 [Fannyhessea vaginae]|nr:hypothetical protein HMPREF3232_01264 [Fannyhessea vaginae]
MAYSRVLSQNILRRLFVLTKESIVIRSKRLPEIWNYPDVFVNASNSTQMLQEKQVSFTVATL